MTDADHVRMCSNCLTVYDHRRFQDCPYCDQVDRKQRYKESIADQVLTALNFLRANELDNVTLHHDNPDFFGPNNIITVSGHWTNHLDRDFTGETLLESLEKAVKAKQRATV